MGGRLVEVRKTCLIWCALVFFFLSTVFAQTPTVYRYDPQTGLWKKADASESEILVEVPSVENFINSNVVLPILGTVILQPTTEVQSYSPLMVKSQSNKKWYFYMTYPVDGAERKYEIIAGQNERIGTATVKSENNRLLVSFLLFDGWLASESSLNVLTQEPTNLNNEDLAPGKFPYKQQYSPMVDRSNYDIEMTSFTSSSTDTLYILLHLAVVNGTRVETAWGAGEEEQMCVEVVGGKTNWYVKKPGEYASKFLTATIVSSSHPVAVTFSNFDDLSLEGGGGDKLPVYYAFAEDLYSAQNWIRATDLNQVSFNLEANQALTMFHRIACGAVQSGTYRNTATITFTLQAVKNYIENQ